MKRRRLNATQKQSIGDEGNIRGLIMTANAASTVSFEIRASSGSCKYNLNETGWTDYTSNTEISLNSGDVLYWVGDLKPTQSTTKGGIGQFSITGDVYLSGTPLYMLPYKTLTGYDFCGLFDSCDGITVVSANFLPSTTLAEHCYTNMFSNCTSLTSAPELPATTLTYKCYCWMFNNCTALTIAPALPATTLADSCYDRMFRYCKSLATPPSILPAMVLTYGCYAYMFEECDSLTTAPKLPATTLAEHCYEGMFYKSGLVTAPELPAKELRYYCYAYMFQSCINLNYIKILARDISAPSCLDNWIYRVSDEGTFVQDQNTYFSAGDDSGRPYNWTVVNAKFTPKTCINLAISAENVASGKESFAKVHYTALVEGEDESGLISTKTISGVESIEIGQNKKASVAPKTVTFSYLNKTATTPIIQGPWYVPYKRINIDLNNEWQLSSTVTNPDSSAYDGVYESYSNKGVHYSGASMYIDIADYTNFKLYIRSYAESNKDYVMVSQLDKTLTPDSSYSDTTLVKAHTRDNQKSGTTIDDYTLVEFTDIPEGTHRIQIIYRKDYDTSRNDDRGYVLIPKNQ